MSFCEFWFMNFVIPFFWPPHLSSNFWSSFARFSHESRCELTILHPFIFYINTITRFILYLPLNMASRCGWCVCLALAKMANHVSSNSFSLRQKTFSMHCRAVDVIFNCLLRLCMCGVFGHLSMFITSSTLQNTRMRWTLSGERRRVWNWNHFVIWRILGIEGKKHCAGWAH